jgi:DNA polymerase-3 subunit beta
MLLLKTSRDALLVPLQAVSGVIEKRHTMPILSNVLIEKVGERLTFTATDIEMQIRTVTTGHADGEDAAITVGARKLQDILRALPDTDVSLITLEDRRLAIKAGRGRFQLQVLPAEEYPLLVPPASDATRFSVPQRTFKQQLALVDYAMAKQDIRYYLNGLLLIADGKTLTLVATDGHRLAYAASELEAAVASRCEVILPHKTISELARLIGDNDDSVDVALTGNQAAFRFGAVEFVTKLIDGKFPDYQRVIPQDHPDCVVLARLPLLAALQRVAILSNEKFHGVRLVLDKGVLSIISSNVEQEEAREEIEIDFQGERLDIGFNVVYLLDVLNNVSSETIEWRFRDGDSSALVTLPGNDSFKYVVMPMRI